MKKILTISLASIVLLSSQLHASPIYYTGDYIVSNLVSIRPIVNSNKIISNIVSIRPEFVVPKVTSFYSKLVNIIDMPDVYFTIDDKPIDLNSSVYLDSKLKLACDFTNFSMKSNITSVDLVNDNISKSEIVTKALNLANYKILEDIPNNFNIGDTYKLKQIVKINNEMTYEVCTVPFTVDADGLVKFISNGSNVMYQKYITVNYSIYDELNVKNYNMYIELSDGTRRLVGENLSVDDTRISSLNGIDSHEYRFKLLDTEKQFRYVFERID